MKGEGRKALLEVEMLRPIALMVTFALTACAGKIDYIRPSMEAVRSNAKVIEKSRDAVWNASVPELGKQYFVINNLDKSSGFINLSYSGDPERYIDCGRIIASGQDVAGAKARHVYKVGLVSIERRMDLEGRVNLIFEDLSPNTTRVTANTRYVVTRTLRSSAAYNVPQIDTISFNSGGGASFPPGEDGRFSECVSTGMLEAEILSAIK